jgi:glycerol-3-phosphate acyltransferase PlsX
MKIAVDAMGGDYAPREIVRGALDAARTLNVNLALVGKREAVENELVALNARTTRIEIVHAPDVIDFDEAPARAVKERAGASVRVMCDLVQSGQADACVTMGHTGAALIAALMTFGRIPGVSRPAVAVPIFDLQPNTYVIDAGANVDCKPEYLVQFARLGAIYLERARGIPNPTVALLANGAEDNKGNAVIQAAFPLLKNSGLNFIGNVEGYDIPTGRVNVLICDALWGNIVIKYTESLTEHLLNLADAEFARIFDDAHLQQARGVLDDLRRRGDYAETGAIPLLGVNHLIFLGHGRSRAQAVTSAIREAMVAVEARLIDALRAGLA